MINPRKKSGREEDRYVTFDPILDNKHFETDESDQDTFVRGRSDVSESEIGGSYTHIHSDTPTESERSHTSAYDHEPDVSYQTVQSSIFHNFNIITGTVNLSETHAHDGTSDTISLNTTYTDENQHQHIDTIDPLHLKINLIKRKKMINCRVSRIPFNTCLISNAIISNQNNYDLYTSSEECILKITNENDLNGLIKNGEIEHQGGLYGEHSHSQSHHIHATVTGNISNDPYTVSDLYEIGSRNREDLNGSLHYHDVSLTTTSNFPFTSGTHSHPNGNSMPTYNTLLFYKKNKTNPRKRNIPKMFFLSKIDTTDYINESISNYLANNNQVKTVTHTTHKGDNAGAHKHQHGHFHTATSALGKGDGYTFTKVNNTSTKGIDLTHQHTVQTDTIITETSESNDHTQGLSTVEPPYTRFYLYRRK